MSMVWEFVDSTDNVKYIMLAYYLPIPSHLCVPLQNYEQQQREHPYIRGRERESVGVLH